jgi:hypothetical protein
MRRHLRAVSFLLRLAIVGIVLLALYRIELSMSLLVLKPQRWQVLLDDSGSMQSADADGRTRFTAARQDLDTIRGALGDDVRLVTVTLRGAPAGGAPGTGPTHLYAAIAENALRGEPLDRLIVLTDGRDTAAHDFGRLGRDLKTADVAVAVRVYGSTKQAAAAALFATPDSEVLRLGEDLIVQGAILAPEPAAAYPLRLFEDGEEVLAVTIPQAQRDAFQLTYRPKAAGLHQYTLKLPDDGRRTGSREASFMVRVTPEKIRVLLIEGVPRYEFKFLRYLLDSDPLIELVSLVHLPGGGVYLQGKPLHANAEQGLINSRTDLFKYDVAILLDV